MQTESPEKKFFSCYTTYIDRLLYTDYQNINQYTKYIATWNTVSHNVRNVGNVAKKVFSGSTTKTGR